MNPARPIRCRLVVVQAPPVVVVQQVVVQQVQALQAQVQVVQAQVVQAQVDSVQVLAAVDAAVPRVNAIAPTGMHHLR